MIATFWNEHQVGGFANALLGASRLSHRLDLQHEVKPGGLRLEVMGLNTPVNIMPAIGCTGLAE